MTTAFGNLLWNQLGYGCAANGCSGWQTAGSMDFGNWMMNGCGGYGYNSGYSDGFILGSTALNIGAMLAGAFITRNSEAGGGAGGTDWEERLETLEAERDDIQTKIDENQAIIDDPSSKMDQSLFETEANLKTAKDEVTTAEGNVTTAQTALTNATANVAAKKAAWENAPDAQKTQAKNEYDAAVLEENSKRTALENAKKELEQKQEKLKTAVLNNENAKAIIETAKNNKAKLIKKLTQVEEKIAQAERHVVKSEGREAKRSSKFISTDEYNSLFDKDGNLVYNSEIEYKDAAKKASAYFVKNQTLDNAKKLIKLYDNCSDDEKDELKSSIGRVLEKAQKMIDENKNKNKTTETQA